MQNRKSQIAKRKPATAPRRAGFSALLAMLYLALMASLAVGFYASTNSANMISENDRRTGFAASACESGMEFMHFQLGQLVLPHTTNPSTNFTNLYNQLKSEIENTGNMGAKQVIRDGDVIHIPGGADQYIRAGNGGEFKVTVRKAGTSEVTGQMKVLVKVIGRHAGYPSKRAVQMKFDLAENASDIFNFGVASRGSIQTEGSSRIKGATDPTKGSILSVSPSGTPVMINGREVSGHISVADPNAVVTVGAGASVGGSTDHQTIMDNYVHKGVPAPEFPTIDTDEFKSYATNLYIPGSTTLINTRIPANTNPTFGAGTVIQGVLYIETPNKVTFNGNTTVQGVIVTQNNPIGNLTTNTITFKGNTSVTGVETLDASFGDLRSLTGAFLLAPGFATSFTGSFGTVGGAIVADKITMSGNAGGTIMGSIITLTDTPLSLNGSSEIIIASTGTTEYPAGVFFSSRYAALPDTYEEVKP